MVDVGQQLAVHLLVLRPVGAVHVRHVEVVALIAPALVEDLLELLLRIEIHAQCRVHASLSRRGRIAIGVDEEQPWTGRAARGAAAAATPAATAGAIEQLASVGADGVLGRAGDEGRGATIAQAIADDAAAATGPAAPAAVVLSSLREACS